MADRAFIPDLEIENAQIKWAFSHFDGREDTFNAEGDYNFTVLIPESRVDELTEQGWNIKEKEGYEEGDPPEFLLKCKISYKYEPPKIYLIKIDPDNPDRKKKVRASQEDLSDIKRSTVEQIDIILTPSRWVVGGREGLSPYVKEMYAVVKQSRFSARYDDYEEV